MLLLSAKHIKKCFGDRNLFEIPSLEILQGDRIGIVGANGSGKTTLLRILIGEIEPDAGTVRRHCDVSCIRQTEDARGAADAALLSEFRIAGRAGSPHLSGGERTRAKIAGALSKCPVLLFADEPTTNLDAQGCALLEKKLERVETLVLISHDRALLDAQCTAILELREGALFHYAGNYSAYRQQREAEKARAGFEYEAYVKERGRLEEVAREKRQKSRDMTRGPRGISGSEAKMRGYMMTRKPDVKERSLAQAAKAVEKRLERLPAREKPREPPAIRINFALTDPPMGRYVAEAESLSFSYGDHVLLDRVAFRLPNREKIALTGNNGAGKSTLLNLLWQRHPAIRIAPKARFGYFRQGQDDIDPGRSALENMLCDAVQSEGVARALLARLLFRGDDVFRPAGVLSGGERVKLALAMLLARPCNVLLLDEPTNHLDMPSIEAVQALIQEYEGAVLFVSHDAMFSAAVAGASLHIDAHRLLWNPDGLPANGGEMASPPADRALLEHRKAVLLSRFGAPDADADALLAELKALNARLRA